MKTESELIWESYAESNFHYFIERLNLWCVNVEHTESDDWKMFEQWIPKFLYQGQMFRVLDFEITATVDAPSLEGIVASPHAQRLCSWCPDEESLQHYISYNSNVEFSDDSVEALEAITLVQEGIGLDVAAVSREIDRLGIKRMYGIERAASVKEILAYYQNPDIHDTETWYNENEHEVEDED